MAAGSFILLPEGTKLYFWTKEEAILQFHGMGPLDVQYANRSDDPRMSE